MDSGLRTVATRAKAAAVGCAGFVLLGVLQQHSLANEIDFLRPQRYPSSGRLELRTPDGLDCSATGPDRPSINIGAGVTDPQVLQGTQNADYFFRTQIGPPEPVGGIAIVIPFGGASSGNCAQLVEYEEASMRTRKALELYELGLITEDEFKAIGRQAYSTLLTD